MAKTRPQKSTQRDVDIPYKPTSQELVVIDEYSAAKRQKRPALGFTLQQEGEKPVLAINHEDERTGLTLLKSSLGTTSAAFTAGLINQLSNASSKGSDTNVHALNFMLSVITGIEPKDELEAMLAAQMASVHMATMTYAQRLANSETISQQDSAERAFNKLARTFTAQVEALKRYRTGGEQKVTVEHVTVNDGG